MPIDQNFPLPQINNDLHIDNSKPNCKVIFTIFAGRQKYLRTLFNYLNVLIKQDIITEVHLWNFTREEKDYDYIKEYVKTNPKYRILNPMRHPMPIPWNDYYNFYYCMDYSPDDIIVKCDDDVLYLDLNTFCGFLNKVKPDGYYYPNIINNDVCAYIQKSYGIHDLIGESDIYGNYNNDITPLSGWDVSKAWFGRVDTAQNIHRLFFENKDRFKISTDIIPWKGRISINLFAVKFEYLVKSYALFTVYGEGNDEAFISFENYKHMPGSNFIVPFFVISHFSFGPQMKTSELDDEFCDKYYELSLKEIAS